MELFPVWLLLGPRQVGKNSLFQKCARENRAYVNLDNLQERRLANEDPPLFLRNLTPPFTIDEIQYAPGLLSPIKELVDRGLPPGSIWLTGSQNFEVMRGVRESLAGRVAILNLYGLTDTEKMLGPLTPDAYFEKILESNFPKLTGVTNPDSRQLYLSSYTQTYIEKDVRELLGIEKRREFEIFVRACALRSGHLVNYEDLARDCHISPATAKSWLSLLEDSFLLKLLPPWHSNTNKRLIKTPKLYFYDLGLAAHLAGWIY